MLEINKNMAKKRTSTDRKLPERESPDGFGCLSADGSRTESLPGAERFLRGIFGTCLRALYVNRSCAGPTRI